jgi:phage gp36-like protein
MPYVTQSQVTAKIPAPVLNDALDDDGDGQADPGSLDNIIALASQEVDSYLMGLFNTPFQDPAPAKVQSAAFSFVCEMIYQRRAVPEEKNPFTAPAKFWREHLQKVGNRELPFDAQVQRAFWPGAKITTGVSNDVQST